MEMREACQLPTVVKACTWLEMVTANLHHGRDIKKAAIWPPFLFCVAYSHSMVAGGLDEMS